jgi:outer membrane protein assembly factor BamE (lipoprotein component of BamABCDE complex)
MKRQLCGFIVVSIVSLLALTVSGCITVGEPFSLKPVKRIAKGTTTQQEIQAMFGNPIRTGMEDGNPTWTYIHYKASLFGAFEGRDLIVIFDPSGRVKSVSYNTTAPDKE